MKEKPNVLVILSDQQRFDTIKVAGYPHMITPNLDKLVKEGCLYRNAYSSNPICMPARHDLLMGMPSAAHGFFSNCKDRPVADYRIPTLPRLFAENGYRTAAIGKMHFYPTRMHHGYSEMYLMEEIPKNRQDDAYASYLKEIGCEEIENLHGVRPYVYHEPQTAQVDLPNYETNWISDKVTDWIDNNGDHPFMLCVGYIKPHPPWDIPAEYQGIYQDKDIPKAIERSREFPNNPEFDPWYGDGDTEEEKRKIREAYYTAITLVDESVGKIIEHLRERGQLDNTLVIFTSDHGEMLQDKGYYSKELPYEGSAHIPMIVRYPEKFAAGEERTEFVDLTDIMPTCLDIAGIEYPQTGYKMYGASVLDAKPANKNREYVMSATGYLNDKRLAMCRTHEYKYVYRYIRGTEEMYDMINDKEELHNCIHEMRDTEVYRDLRNRVLAYEEKWGPKGAVKDGDLIQIEGDYHDSDLAGKYHLWSNHQFQNMTELKGKARLDQFDKEIEKACNGNIVNFENQQWKEDYQTGRKEYCEDAVDSAFLS
ncbi:MAG: sulfatase-like hydrolase/transferase [Eubacteriales bacterium]